MVGGGEGGRGSQAPLTPAFPPTFPLQAQTRAALLRVLQENEEYWGSTEDRPSSLAQDVCEVGGGEEEGESAGTVPGWESRTSPLLTPSPLHGPQLLEEHTERAPRISQEFGERMAHCCLGGLAEFLQRYVGRGGGRGTGLGGGRHQYPGSKRERRDGRQPSKKGQGRVSEDHRLCGAECPARDSSPAVIHLSHAHPFSCPQLPAAGGAIPRASRSTGAAT